MGFVQITGFIQGNSNLGFENMRKAFYRRE